MGGERKDGEKRENNGGMVTSSVEGTGYGLSDRSKSLQSTICRHLHPQYREHRGAPMSMRSS